MDINALCFQSSTTLAVDTLYTRDGLLRLIEKQQWQIALSFVGNDAAMQKLLLDHLISAGQIQMATQLAQKMGLMNFIADLAQVESIVPSLPSGEASGYLDLDLEQESILFCDTEERVQEAMEKISLDGHTHFGGSSHSVVGLDVEWKPTTTSAMASILQIASKANIFIIDLLALHVRIASPSIPNVALNIDSSTRIMTFCSKSFFRRFSAPQE